MQEVINLRDKKRAPDDVVEEANEVSGSDTDEQELSEELQYNRDLELDMREDSVPDKISWRGSLYIHHPNPWALLIFSAALLATVVYFAYSQKNYLAAGFFTVAFVMILVNLRRKAPEALFSIEADGIYIGTRSYKFSDLKSFWIEYHPYGIKELSLHLKRWYMPYVKVPIINEDPVQIRRFLIKLLPETVHEDSIVDTITRLIGF